MAKKKLSNYDYFVKTNTSQYKGEWIAIANQKIVAHGKNAEKVYKKAQKNTPRAQISLAKTPEEQMLVLKLAK